MDRAELATTLRTGMSTTDPLSIIEYAMKKLFPEKLGRLQYFIRCLIYLVVISVVLPWPLGLGGTVASLVFFALKLMFLDTPRIRSTGWPSWVILFFLVPIVNLVFQVVLFFVRPKNLMPNTALEPTAAAPSVSDAPSNPKAGGESTSASGGGGSALDR